MGGGPAWNTKQWRSGGTKERYREGIRRYPLPSIQTAHELLPWIICKYIYFDFVHNPVHFVSFLFYSFFSLSFSCVTSIGTFLSEVCRAYALSRPDRVPLHSLVRIINDFHLIRKVKKSQLRFRTNVFSISLYFFI